MCFGLARGRGRETKTARLMFYGVRRYEVQPDSVNPSPISLHSAQEFEWVRCRIVFMRQVGV